jgi:hypothetical protein
MWVRRDDLQERCHDLNENKEALAIIEPGKWKS